MVNFCALCAPSKFGLFIGVDAGPVDTDSNPVVVFGDAVRGRPIWDAEGAAAVADGASEVAAEAAAEMAAELAPCAVDDGDAVEALKDPARTKGGDL